MAKKKPKRSSLYVKTMARLKAAQRRLNAKLVDLVELIQTKKLAAGDYSLDWERQKRVYCATATRYSFRIYPPKTADTLQANITGRWLLVTYDRMFRVVKEQLCNSRKTAMAAAYKKTNQFRIL